MLHFTRAAESLYISQPTLSICIQQLEEELKTKLFVRVGRSVQLTETGQVLLNHARLAVEELEAANIEIESMTGLLRGKLTIATLPLYGSRILPPWIDAFRVLHPNVHILVRVSRTEDIESGLLSGAFDLGFSLGPPEHSELNVRELFDDHIVAIVSSQHRLAKKKHLSVSDIESVPLALASHRISASRMVGTYFETLKISPTIAIEQDDGHALLELVKLGGSMTFLPQGTLNDDPELSVLTLPEPGMPTKFVALWTHLSPATNAFLKIATANNVLRDNLTI
jgi:LysR family transcriptional regulator, cyn operon transcriptional activator